MASGLVMGGGLEPEAMAPAPEGTGWTAEEEPAGLEKGLLPDEDCCSDCSSYDKAGTGLQSFVPEGKTLFPEIFQTSQLLFYERFRAYQDYILADCKASEVREFTAEFLEKVLEPSGWRAVWHTNVFEVLVEVNGILLFGCLSLANSTSLQTVRAKVLIFNVTDVDFSGLKAVVRLTEPYLCESRLSSFTRECMSELLELKEHRLPLQELWVVFDDSGVFDQTALAVEHVRYVFGYQKNSNIQAKGARGSGQKVTHVVSSAMMPGLLRSLLKDRLCQEPCEEETEIQFHSDPLSAINACYEGDSVIVCPGHYVVHGSFSIADSIELEGYGLPDDIVIEKRGKGDTFVDCTGADIKISSIKFVQHGAVEGILSIHRGKTTLENCVLQCETTGVTVRTSAELLMKNSDLYGAKGAGIEIYPGSKCTLSDNGIHHCKEGILIKDFLDEHYDIPKITMMNNVIHNNEGYGVVLVKPTIFSDLQENVQDETEENKALKIQTSGEVDAAEKVDLEELIQCATGKMELYASSDPLEPVEGNCEIVNELVAASTKKGQIKKKRLSELGIMQADVTLMSQEMFVSIVGNQFKWNGKGSFGTFLF
ncbi:SHC SH2 domain-binding protein 1 [Trichechus manatus latirostris]|uniref:SHC SH2 domain-binding protein 1 n=1 Tax=Trichechus manatus latirostris TaxID=127582 RepID=A0A2Y9QTE6_TRIMA|nr:SHC SH2 domain-binding protein 1 [Trichechus manatus latirostris]